MRFIALCSVAFLSATTYAGAPAPASAPAPANAPRGYYAQPALHGDTLIFQSGGDLWITTVPADGQQAHAQRLTSAPGLEARPMISPDGTTVAYLGAFDGNTEVFTLPVSGGSPRRMTFHPGRDIPVAWTPDGAQLLIRSDRQSPLGNPEFFLVPAAGGTARRLPFGEGGLGSFNAQGDLAFNPHSNEGWYWKGYRGGTAPDIWVTDKDFKNYRQVTKTDENELFPMWVQGRIYFLSDTDGRMNLWSCKPDGSDRTQHTHAGATDFDLRWPSADSAGAPRIAFAQGSDLWLYDAAKNTARKLDITLQGDRLDDRVRLEPVAETMTELALSPDSKRIAVVSRGEVLVGPVGKPKVGVPQAWMQLPGMSGSREGGVVWTSDDELLLVSDRGGEGSIVAYDADGAAEGDPETLQTLVKADRWIFAPQASPDGRYVVYGDKSLRLLLRDTQAKKDTVIGTSPAGEVVDYRFSADGKWVAWVATLDNGFGQIHLYEIASGKDTLVSNGMSDDRFPRWDPKGQYLYFASAREINPRLDQFDMSFATIQAWSFFAVPLKATTPPPLQPAAAQAGVDLKKWAEAPPPAGDDAEAEDDNDKMSNGKGDDGKKGSAGAGAAVAGKDSSAGKSAGAPAAPASASAGTPAAPAGAPAAPAGAPAALAPVQVDLNGFMARAVHLPVEAGLFRNVDAVYGGLVYLRAPEEGVVDEIWPPPPMGAPGAVLEHLDLVAGEAKPLQEATVNFASVSPSARAVVVSSGGGGGGDSTVKVIHLDGGGEPDTIPVGQLKIKVDVAAEWAQIFDEAWRLQRDFFWKPDLGGVDWKAVRMRYAGLLPRVGTRAELNDLVGEMSAELGTSHTYISGGDDSEKLPVQPVGLLGVDVTKVPEGFRIDRILADQSVWGGPESPLAAPHRGVKPGDVIVMVDGVSAAGASELGELLLGRGGKQVSLVVKGADGKPRTLEVEALTSELPLRYAAWVEANRQWVQEKSGGKLGYMHLPDMDSEGMVMFVRGFYPQYTKEGLVVDERWNHGGYISQMLLERLRRKPIAADVPREGAAQLYPARATSGPMVALINEGAGSDGDIFPNGFRLYGLGPLIGTRTWGGVVGIRSDKPFVDGGMATQPEFAWWDPVLGFKLENHGVDPDIVVPLTPADIAAGRDPQLERALAELMPKLGKPSPIAPPVPGKGNTPVPPAAR